MASISLFINNNLSATTLKEIISIKSVAWPYSFEQQVEWMQKNLNKDDFHVFLQDDKEYVAYLNLIKIKVWIDNVEHAGLGIGNVCSKIKGKGFGVELIQQVGEHLRRVNKIGLLFCKEELISFYGKNDWSVIEQENVTLGFAAENITTMIFNYTEDFNMFKYLDKSF